MYQFLADVLPYLVAFYFLDAFAFVARGQSLFAAAWGARFEPKDEGWRLIGLLAVAEAVAAYDPPLFFTPDGVYAPKLTLKHVPQQLEPDDLRFVPFERMGAALAEQKTVRTQQGVLLKCSSPVLAARLARILEELRTTDTAQRMGRWERFVSEATDLDAVGTLRQDTRRILALIKTLASILFVSMFVVLPLALWSEAWRPVVPLVALLLIPLYVVIVVLSRRALKTAGSPSTLSVLLPMMLFPPGAMHAPVVVSKDLYARFDPLALAATFLEPEAFRIAARKALFRVQGAAVSAAETDRAEHWRIRVRAYARLLTRLGTSVGEILAAPERRDSTAEGYCPACAIEYRAGFTTCVDCGVALLGFETSERA